MIYPTSILCLTNHTGILVFDKDVALKNVPESFIQNQKLKLSACPKAIFAQRAGYYIERNHVVFYLHESCLPHNIDENEKYFFVCGEFNHWQKNVDFALNWNAKERAWIIKLPLKQFPRHPVAFKFVTALDKWIEPSANFVNIVTDDRGNRNLLLDFERTGNHFVFF